MEFSVCIDAVFRGLDQNAALEAVKAAGFGYYEFWGWWNRDLDSLKAKAGSLDLRCAALCTRFISLTDPARREAYLEGLGESVKAAKKMGAGILISQVGEDTGAVRAYQHRSAVAGLRAAVPLLEESGITLVIEPLNGKIDHPGVFLESSGEGFELVEEAGSPMIKLLFDIYHQQITEGDVVRRISANVDKIGHLHTAGNPGRHELYSGELNYPWIFRAVEEAGYRGFAGIEYNSRENAAAGLRKVRDLLFSPDHYPC
jgi:hydroxypyruvate isomerase